MMLDGGFSHIFASIDFENKTTKNEIDKYNKDFNSILELIPLRSIVHNKYTLIFKKMEKDYLGLLDATNKIMTINTNNTYSFVHELAHLIDYELTTDTNKTYSLSSCRDFILIYNKYVDQFLDYNITEDPNYICRPTEVFARLFELYIGAKLDLERLGYALDELGIVSQFCNYPIDLLDETLIFFDMIFEHYA